LFKIRTEYLEATLGPDKRLEITKELIHGCQLASVPVNYDLSDISINPPANVPATCELSTPLHLQSHLETINFLTSIL